MRNARFLWVVFAAVHEVCQSDCVVVRRAFSSPIPHIFENYHLCIVASVVAFRDEGRRTEGNVPKPFPFMDPVYRIVRSVFDDNNNGFVPVL